MRFLLLSYMVVMSRGRSFEPCSPNQGSSPSGSPPLPELPNQFYTHIEANIQQKNMTVDVDEYYDYTNNRGAIKSTRNGVRYWIINNFVNYETLRIFENNTCTVGNLTNQRFNIFNFTSDATGGHVLGVKDILIFGKDYGETYIGQETIRGIRVNHWQSCLKSHFRNITMTFTLDYYFSTTGYNTSSGNLQIPIRAVVNGTAPNFGNHTLQPGNHLFYHVYDFSSFVSGPIQDSSAFEIPFGVFCNQSRNPQMKLPPIPQQFSAGLEQIIYPPVGRPMEKVAMQVYFDAASKLVRMDLSAGGTPGPQRVYTSNRPVSNIYDEASGVKFSIDLMEKNCTTSTFNASELSLTRDPSLRQQSQDMVDALQLLSIGHKNYTYQGKKTYRGLSVDAWATYNQSTNIMEEVFFLPAGRGPSNTMSGQLVGMFINSKLTSPYLPVGSRDLLRYVHVYDFVSGHPYPDVFDVSVCFMKRQAYADMKFATIGSYERDVWMYAKEFYSAARASIAMAASVSAIRIGDLTVEQDDNDKTRLRIWFKLLDALPDDLTAQCPKTSRSWDARNCPSCGSGCSAGQKCCPSGCGTSCQTPVKVKNGATISLDEAKKNIHAAVEKKVALSFVVQYPTGQKKFTVLEESLQEVPATKATQTSITQYSGAALAGMAIGMLVVGALLGLAAAYFIYKKIDVSVPYKVQD